MAKKEFEYVSLISRLEKEKDEEAKKFQKSEHLLREAKDKIE